jgi:hypothetical protein
MTDRHLPCRWRKIRQGRSVTEWSAVMKIPEGGSYDPETITLLRTVLDAAWDALLPEHQARTSKAHLAQRMLKLAAQGERDPIRLRTRALIEIAP